MCGIVGYVGSRDAENVLLHGLRKLEYRGYDSAGVCTIRPDGRLEITKAAGRIDILAAKLAESPAPGKIGIGHTRWATHGPATDENAHPHIGGNDLLAVVHNGVIENYRSLKQRLESEGYCFRSGTDTEVIAHLIASCLENQLLAQAHQGPSAAEDHALFVTALEQALDQLQGAYGLAVVFQGAPDVVLAARRGSPLVVGVGDGEHFLASDASPLVGYTDKIVYLSDHEVAVVTAHSLRVIHREQGPVQHRVKVLDVEAHHSDRGKFAHYMLKEIFEQPESLENTMRGRLDEHAATAHFGGLNLSPQQLRRVSRILMTACGTSWHASLVGEYIIEELARLPVDVEYAS